MEQSTTTTLFSNLYVLLQPVLVALIAALAAFLTKWINEKVKNEKAAGIINRSKDVLFALVKKANQTVVDGLKAASADGTITDDEKKTIKDNVIKDFKDLLGMDGLAAITYAAGISSSAGSLDSWIDAQIEAAVHDVKLAKAAAGVTTEKTAGFPSAPTPS